MQECYLGLITIARMSNGRVITKIMLDNEPVSDGKIDRNSKRNGARAIIETRITNFNILSVTVADARVSPLQNPNSVICLITP